MGFFHFDESLHPEAQFALGTFVYSEESLDTCVREALQKTGLSPGVDEFKSGIRCLSPGRNALLPDKSYVVTR